MNDDLNIFVGTILALFTLGALAWAARPLLILLVQTWRAMSRPKTTGRTLFRWRYSCDDRYRCIRWLNKSQNKMYSRLDAPYCIKEGDIVYDKTVDENNTPVIRQYLVRAVGDKDATGGRVIKVEPRGVVRPEKPVTKGGVINEHV